MTIEAKIIADSISPNSKRLTTFQLKYHRFIHPEFLTHRKFSRNSSSSRAVPVERQLQMIMEDPAIPVHWGKNKRGMQATEEIRNKVVIRPGYHPNGEYNGSDLYSYTCDGPEEAWITARDNAVAVARAYHEAGYHKQVVNRIIEPFSHISVIVTATDYDNFFTLRCHEDAQPEIKALAELMYEAYSAGTPTEIGVGEWHLPYILPDEKDQYDHDTLIKVSAARCARVSYLTHDGKSPSLEADLSLYDRLVGSVPLHASPVEHQATPDEVVLDIRGTPEYVNPHLSGNFAEGWKQYRKMLDEEHIDYYPGPSKTG